MSEHKTEIQMRSSTNLRICQKCQPWNHSAGSQVGWCRRLLEAITTFPRGLKQNQHAHAHAHAHALYTHPFVHSLERGPDEARKWPTSTPLGRSTPGGALQCSVVVQCSSAV